MLLRKEIILFYSILEKKDFDKIGNSEEPWFCWSWRKDNIPFQNLSPLQIQKLFVIPKKCQNQNAFKKICWCKICNKNNNYPENGLTCCYCKYATHKKCAIYKAANKFICCELSILVFPFTNIQSYDILDLIFNSFQFICSENQILMEKLLMKQWKFFKIFKEQLWMNTDKNF